MSKVLLSFCIPVMNRLADLQATLRQNLDDNRVQRDRVEFIVVCFDRDTETSDWIQQNFVDDLSTGYLRYYQLDYLQNWHFGWAKNSFRGIARGRIYASLDGDNFTGPAGGQHIIDVFEANDYNCIFHQFQGDWGDGTCGRIALTMQDYDEIGYDDNFLPRQWDELDAILSILVQHPERRYVCYQKKSIVQISGPFARFINENNIQMEMVEVDGQLDPLLQIRSGVAVGQHVSTYVQDDERLKFSSIFNHLSSFFKNTQNSELRNQYVTELVEVQRTMAERLDPLLLLDWFLAPQQEETPVLQDHDIPLVACIRNELHLEEWLNYYRDLGVTHFLLIDDHSSEPIAECVSAEDVWIWKPTCGKFRYSKAFWMELLLRCYACGCWVITVDSDEYLELPGKSTTRKTIEEPNRLQQLRRLASENNLRYFAGFLLDMSPSPESLASIRSNQLLQYREFNRYQFRPTATYPVYLQNNTVKWSYGEYADWAYRIDIRFRLNRAFDSLRKFPVFLMDTDIHLNQGFHDLIISGEKRTADEISRSDLLVIRHYKLFNTQYDASEKNTRPIDSYHHETRKNLERLQGNVFNILAIAAMSPFTFPFYDHLLVPVPGRSQITLRVANANEDCSFAEQLNRTANILLVKIDVSPQYHNGVIEARSMEDAVWWLMQQTPFSVVVKSDASTAVLTTEAESVELNYEASNPTGSWLTGGPA